MIQALFPLDLIRPISQLRLLLLSLCFLSISVFGQVSTPQSELDIALAPGCDHFPLTIPLSIDNGVNREDITVASDSSWVTAEFNGLDGITLSFTTSSLTNSSYTATISIVEGDNAVFFFINATLAPLNINYLLDDPDRLQVYGLHENADKAGALVVYDQFKEEAIGCLTLGINPTDLDISSDGSELMVINAGSESISVIEIASMTLKEEIDLSLFGSSTSSDISAHVLYGSGNIIYYIDGNWAPTLHVFDRKTETVIQSVSTGDHGLGDFVLNPDGKSAYGWAQYGWGAGWAGSYVVSYIVAEDGTLTINEKTSSSYPTPLDRDPLDTPILVANDGKTVFVKEWGIDSENILSQLKSFSYPVYAISPGAEIASTSKEIIEVETGNSLYTFSSLTNVQCITSNYTKLVYFDASSREIKSIDLLDVVGNEILGRELSPANGSIVLDPGILKWSPVPGALAYKVYLSETEDIDTSDESLFIGEVNLPFIELSKSLIPGTTYYWSVIIETENGDVGELINSFTVSNISSDVSEISTTTLAGYANHEFEFTINAGGEELDWYLDTDVDWIHFAEDSGKTPATIKVRVDATSLAKGIYNTEIRVRGATTDYFTLPVSCRVDSISPKIIKNRANTPFSYVISKEDDVESYTYLLEINSINQSITRMVRVGSSVTDLAIHEEDNKIYVPNWVPGKLLVVNLDTFEVEQTFAFKPFGGTGYSEGDIYRVAAGGKDRIIVEEEDQWIDISIYDTSSGTQLANTRVREGGGDYDSTGQYYYHGGNNSSGEGLTKFDVLGDQFTELAFKRITAVSYYGSRIVVVSEDGQRIFWNGGVFDPELEVLWEIGELIYSCSTNGRYAFGKSKIYDTESKRVLADMPAESEVSAYNGVTDTLVYGTESGIEYLKLNDPSDFIFPIQGSILSEFTDLEWDPIATATSYKVYLTASDVFDPDSIEDAFITEVSDSKFSLGDMSDATYFWKVDTITPYGVISGEVYYFTLSSIAVDKSEINIHTISEFKKYQSSLSLTLEAEQNWSVDVDVPWLSMSEQSGNTSSTLTLTVDATVAGVGSHQGKLTVKSNGENLYSIPVNLLVDPTEITMIKSDAESSKAYAISESSAEGSFNAFLIELDSENEEITRVVPVGSSVTDIAIHNLDNAIYVTNWRLGKVLRYNRSSLEIEDEFLFETGGGYYTDQDPYAISAGAKGRIMIEAEDQWIDIFIVDTDTGAVLADTSAREGGGDYDSTGRYYYHGGNNSSGEGLTKFDVLADQFTSLAFKRITSVSYYGSRVVVVSEDGERIFWNGGVFDSDLNVLWEIGEIIYSCSLDGSYAMAKNRIYNVASKEIEYGMPVETSISVVNSTTGKLIVPLADGFGFYSLLQPELNGPTLSVESVGLDFAELSWSDNSLETGFTLQYRSQEEIEWTNFDDQPDINQTSATLTSLAWGGQTYEVRIKADYPSKSSSWSEIVSFTTAFPPSAPESLSAIAIDENTVSLTWSDVEGESGYAIYRKIENLSWYKISSVSNDVLEYENNNLQKGTTYYYRIVSLNDAIDSDPSAEVSVTTPIQPPEAPSIESVSSIGALKVSVSWSSVANASGYILKRSNVETPDVWTDRATLGEYAINFIDDVEAEESYNYKLFAINLGGASEGSVTTSITTPELDIPSSPSLKVRQLSNSEVYLFWKSALNAQLYKLYRKSDTSEDWQLISTLEKEELSFTDSGLIYENRYEYSIIASNSVGESVRSESIGLKIENQIIRLYEDFEDSLDGEIWDEINNNRIAYGAEGSASSLFFSRSDRYIYFRDIEINNGGKIEFYLRTGSDLNAGIIWDEMEESDELEIFIYGKDSKISHEFISLSNTEYNDWTMVTVEIPDTFYEELVDIYIDHSGYSYYGDEWAMDNFSIISYLPPFPSEPDDVVTSLSENGDLVTMWTPVDKVTSYIVMRKSDGTEWEQLAIVESPSCYFRDSNIEGGKSYTYSVYASNAAGVSDKPAEYRDISSNPDLIAARLAGRDDVIDFPETYELTTIGEMLIEVENATLQGRADVIDNPSEYGLYTTPIISHLYFGESTATIDGDITNLNWLIYRSFDLENWSEIDAEVELYNNDSNATEYYKIAPDLE